jgi:hypothetical protein
MGGFSGVGHPQPIGSYNGMDAPKPKSLSGSKRSTHQRVDIWVSVGRSWFLINDLFSYSSAGSYIGLLSCDVLCSGVRVYGM